MASPYPHTGSLNEKIVVEQNVPVKSTENGQLLDNWVTFKTLFASTNFKSGDEKEIEKAEISSDTIDFIVRSLPAAGITTKMQIVYDTEKYNIRSIGKIERRYLKIKAERIK